MVTIAMEPIGIVHSPYQAKYDAPRQPGVDDRHHEATIELFANCNYEQALEDLSGFDRIWILAWFDQAHHWKPKVLVPRGRVKRGVFSTRSPHRPNPIALTCCELISIDGRSLRVRGIDLLDNTPVLDIKPYVPYADAFPDSRAGWLEELSTETYQVHVAPDVNPGLLPHELWLYVQRVLTHDPHPHPYRRTRILPDQSYELAIQEWRCRYQINDNDVTVLSLGRW